MFNLFNNPFMNLSGANAAGGTDRFASGASRGLQPQFGLITTSGSGNPFDSSQGDQLSAFRTQLQNGVIAPNLNQPALPYTATKGWIV